MPRHSLASKQRRRKSEFYQTEAGRYWYDYDGEELLIKIPEFKQDIWKWRAQQIKDGKILPVNQKERRMLAIHQGSPSIMGQKPNGDKAWKHRGDPDRPMRKDYPFEEGKARSDKNQAGWIQWNRDYSTWYQKVRGSSYVPVKIDMRKKENRMKKKFPFKKKEEKSPWFQVAESARLLAEQERYEMYVEVEGETILLGWNGP